jgi:hypothetical protein
MSHDDLGGFEPGLSELPGTVVAGSGGVPAWGGEVSVEVLDTPLLVEGAFVLNDYKVLMLSDTLLKVQGFPLLPFCCKLPVPKSVCLLSLVWMAVSAFVDIWQCCLWLHCHGSVACKIIQARLLFDYLLCCQSQFYSVLDLQERRVSHAVPCWVSMLRYPRSMKRMCGMRPARTSQRAWASGRSWGPSLSLYSTSIPR